MTPTRNDLEDEEGPVWAHVIMDPDTHAPALLDDESLASVNDAMSELTAGYFVSRAWIQPGPLLYEKVRSWPTPIRPSLTMKPRTEAGRRLHKRSLGAHHNPSCGAPMPCALLHQILTIENEAGALSSEGEGLDVERLAEVLFWQYGDEVRGAIRHDWRADAQSILARLSLKEAQRCLSCGHQPHDFGDSGECRCGCIENPRTLLKENGVTPSPQEER